MDKNPGQDYIRECDLTQTDEKKESKDMKKPRKTLWHSIFPQLFASLTVALGSLIVGFASAYSSPALASMSKQDSIIQPDNEQKSWIGSLLPLFAMVGGLTAGPLIALLGRKCVMIITGFPFIISFLLIALAQDIMLIMIGRGLMGLCVGMATLVFPIYLGETIKAKYRGILGLFPTTLGNSGVLLSYAAGMYLDWSNLAFLGALLPIPYLICAYIIPETPRWYANKGQFKDSIKSLKWLRGGKDVSKEFNDIESCCQIKNTQNSKLPIKKEYLKPITICLLLMFFQQMSGINAIIFYSVDIFKESGKEMDSNVQSIILGTVNVISTIAATILIDKLGRKILLNISSITMVLTLGFLGLYFNARKHQELTSTESDQLVFSAINLVNYEWIPLACLVAYIIGFSIGFGPIPWLMMGEILPAQVKGFGASITTAFNWACSFLITKTFGIMTLKLGSDGTFWLYGIFCVLAVIFIKCFVPETKGKSLEEIEKIFLKNNDKKDLKEPTRRTNPSNKVIQNTDVRWASSLNNIAASRSFTNTKCKSNDLTFKLVNLKNSFNPNTECNIKSNSQIDIKDSNNKNSKYISESN